MCGIAGVFAYHYASNPVDEVELVRMRDRMARRGPDASGLWIGASGQIGLAHRRLAIIDLDARANQPMQLDGGELVITFNGEIYNHAALRAELESEGVVFKTASDTEVLLHLYAKRGEAMLRGLRGMYAFAIWDGRKRALFLARDPYGVKPLYYADDGWNIRFASQVKALLAGGRVSQAQEPAGIVGFYLLGSVPEPFTLYQEIRALPAGCYMWVTDTGAHEPMQHFSLAKLWQDAAESPTEADTREVADALLDSVRHHLVADVPVGAFLSSGIDSGALVGLMRDAGQRTIKTVTVAFDEYQGTPQDEAPLAAETARTYSTDHHVRRVTKAEFLADLPKIFDAMDQPTIDGINTWFVAKATAEQGLKVAISGLGGDELFGGYGSFKDVPQWARMMALPSLIPGLGSAFRKLAPVMFPRANPKLRDLIQFGGSYAGAWQLKRGLFLPAELETVLRPDLVREGLRRLRLHESVNALLRPDPRSAFGRVSILESALYMRNQLLRDTDWATMAHSLEARVPLVDPTLGQVVARHAFAGMTRSKTALLTSPTKPLPSRIARRPKTGFSIPVSLWLKDARGQDAWKAIPSLARPDCPWARRWSHVVRNELVAVPA